MRYVKVLLLAVAFFLSLVFFFQNQASLSQQLVLTLNLFFIPPMSSIPLPFYFLVVAAFALGALFTLCFLVWDKVNLSARLLKHKWQISSLEREVEKLRKKLSSESARSAFLRKADKTTALEAKTGDKTAAAPQPAKASACVAPQAAGINGAALAPDPDRP